MAHSAWRKNNHKGHKDHKENQEKRGYWQIWLLPNLFVNLRALCALCGFQEPPCLPAWAKGILDWEAA